MARMHTSIGSWLRRAGLVAALAALVSTAGIAAPASALLPSGSISGTVSITGVGAANDGFTADSLLVSEYSASTIGADEIDANGNPILSTRRDFITDLMGVEGAAIDPLTGDFLFSTFGMTSDVIAVGGVEHRLSPGLQAAVVAGQQAGRGLAHLE